MELTALIHILVGTLFNPVVAVVVVLFTLGLLTGTVAKAIDLFDRI